MSDSRRFGASRGSLAVNCGNEECSCSAGDGRSANDSKRSVLELLADNGLLRGALERLGVDTSDREAVAKALGLQSDSGVGSDGSSPSGTVATNDDGGSGAQVAGWSEVDSEVRSELDALHDELTALERDVLGSALMSRSDWRSAVVKSGSLKGVVGERFGALADASDSPELASRFQSILGSAFGANSSGNGDDGDLPDVGVFTAQAAEESGGDATAHVGAFAAQDAAEYEPDVLGEWRPTGLFAAEGAEETARDPLGDGRPTGVFAAQAAEESDGDTTPHVGALTSADASSAASSSSSGSSDSVEPPAGSPFDSPGLGANQLGSEYAGDSGSSSDSSGGRNMIGRGIGDVSTGRSDDVDVDDLGHVGAFTAQDADETEVDS